MNITKKIKGLGLLSILAIGLVASLSSFTKKDKGNAVKTKQTHMIRAKEPRVFIERYWNGSTWQVNPIYDCSGNGAICSGSYVAGGSSRTLDDILNQAKGIYLAAGYLATNTINSANILVGKNYPNDPVKISVTITERFSE